MKEVYTKPQMDIEKFITVDVITTSGEITDKEPDTDIPVPWT